MAKNYFQYGGWNSYTLQCATIMTLILPGDCIPCNVACGCGIMTVNSPSGSTLQCGTWLWDDRPLNSLKRLPYWSSASGFDFDHITAVDMSFCTSLRNFILIGPPSAEKMTSRRLARWQISAILDFRSPIMGSLKSPCTISYRTSIETMTLNCVVFEKIAFLQFSDRQTNRWTCPSPVERRLNNCHIAIAFCLHNKF